MGAIYERIATIMPPNVFTHARAELVAAFQSYCVIVVITLCLHREPAFKLMQANSIMFG